MKTIILFLTILTLSFPYTVIAQQTFPNTLSIESVDHSPNATLNDISWIQGHWRGNAFGGIAEEVWTPPLGNSMMCAFKLVVDDVVQFYEIITITEEAKTLMLRLKHFHDDLKGWEEKNETVDFPLVKVTPGKVYFDGFTFEKINDNEMNIYVRIQNKEGIQEKKFSYKMVQKT